MGGARVYPCALPSSWRHSACCCCWFARSLGLSVPSLRVLFLSSPPLCHPPGLPPGLFPSSYRLPAVISSLPSSTLSFFFTCFVLFCFGYPCGVWVFISSTGLSYPMSSFFFPCTRRVCVFLRVQPLHVCFKGTWLKPCSISF